MCVGQSWYGKKLSGRGTCTARCHGSDVHRTKENDVLDPSSTLFTAHYSCTKRSRRNFDYLGRYKWFDESSYELLKSRDSVRLVGLLPVEGTRKGTKEGDQKGIDKHF
ncbi:hypothetical protein CIB48_g9005 [Xylaria polymorpha]|nr:hypothetical protein CIB48_g9005 [Xylaria polymorpha]